MTVLELINLALYNLGVSQRVTDIDDTEVREAVVAKDVYDHALRICLRRYPWSFATKYARLYQVAGPFWNVDPTRHTYVQDWSSSYQYREGDTVRLSSVNYYCILAHTNNTPPNSTYWSTSSEDVAHWVLHGAFANGDWLYTYRQPSDCVYARRLVPPGGDGRQHNDDRTEIHFRRFRDENGLLIAANVAEALLEYTMVDCEDMWTDDLFLQYFAWALAGKMCPSLERAQKTVLECHQYAEATFRLAATWDGNEQQMPEPADAAWIRAR